MLGENLYFLKASIIHLEQSLSVCIRDDAFSDSIQRTDSEASSGPHNEDRASSRNDRQSPCEHTPEHRFGPAIGR